MDPYSAEGELVNIHSAFHQGQYSQVLDFDTSSFSSSNAVPARLLKLRAQIALEQYDEVIADVSGEESTPDFAAAKVLAEYLKDPWDSEEAVETAKKLAGSKGDNLGVQLLAGTVLADSGNVEEALALLSKHQGSLDAVAMIVQIHLQQNRTDLAAKEALNARKWAQDSLLVNVAESWVGLRQGGEKYQSAYYVFEELAQAPATQAPLTLVGQAISEIHLGRLPEAEAALQQALDINAQDADALANLMVLNTLAGKDAAEVMGRLEMARPKHQALLDLKEKTEEFEAARAKYTPKFEA
ncbi:coatomer subunit epsilon [Aulographum hederae CBS 113979]|uniref:Coatomer subunit epsilon n=1 Tax=Aulographum hederae CBS 113979 TaxID=1176131 RepID=A0A6G1H086_9PEZI|nr:coatomer subunit epsilon [Aulographum hederae CBS 113979]